MSVFIQIADRMMRRLLDAGVVLPDLLRYGRPGWMPEAAPRAISAEIGDSSQASDHFGVTTWVTEIRMHLEARPLQAVHRTPMHAADELMVSALAALYWGDRGDAFADDMRALGVQGYGDASGNLGADPCAPSRIERDTHSTSTPVGVITLTLYVRHHVRPGTLSPLTEDA